MNEIQRNYKKQMKEIERDLVKKEEYGEGLFTNKLYKSKFYGDNPRPKSSQRKISYIFLIIAAILFFTNPSINDFKKWTKTELDKKVNSNLKNDLTLLSGSGVVNIKIVRKNYYLFSIYESSLDDIKSVKIIGICKMFIMLPQ